jgi:hypothetical protein
MLGCAAVVRASGGPAAATYGFAVVATVAMTMYRPAHSALLPALAKSPQELTSANAVRGMLDSLATLGGPLIAAVLLAASGPAAVFAACSAASLLAGFTLLARLADETVLARMFAGFEAILTLGVAIGGLIAPLVIELLGVRLALVAIGLMAPLAVAASWVIGHGRPVRSASTPNGRRRTSATASPAPVIDPTSAALAPNCARYGPVTLRAPS